MTNLTSARTHARPSRALLVLSVVLALGLLAACGSTPPDPKPQNVTAYVAMGDSYTAVAGTGPFTDSACRRSTEDYPNLVAKDLGIKKFTDVSCGGATSDNLLQTQGIQGVGSRQPQLDPVTKNTKLITVGIGLNNQNLSAALLYACTKVNGVVPSPANCSLYLKQPDSALVTLVQKIAGQVATSLTNIRQRAPKARIILVGYPRVLADDTDCPAQLPMGAAASARLRLALKLMNQDLAATAKAAKVDYVDMYAASIGHDVCSTDPWVNGVQTLADKAFQFHPYKAYHRAVADQILALLHQK